MSQIQVNTSDLRSCSQEMNRSADELGDTQRRINNATAGVGNAYDGQLKRALGGIVGGDYQVSEHLKSRAIDLGNELGLRASGFEKANEAGKSAMLVSSNQFDNFIHTSPILEAISTYKSWELIKALFLWQASGIVFGGLIPITTIISQSSFFSKNQILLTSREQIKHIIGFLDEWNKPIDWIADHKSASKYLHKVFRQIGRNINNYYDTIGYIKKWDQLATRLEWGGRTMGAIGNINSIDTFLKPGPNTTNADAVRAAIGGILFWIPVPGVSDAIADKVIPLLPFNPTDRWEGFVVKEVR